MPTDTDDTEAIGTTQAEAEQAARSARIAAQNDAFRRAVVPGGPPCDLPGRVVCTRAVHARGAAFVVTALEAVAGDETFTPDNDPHGERDFGAVEVAGVTLWWKLDLFDRDLRFGSERPDDPDATVRVLTVMLPEDY